MAYRLQDIVFSNILLRTIILPIYRLTIGLKYLKTPVWQLLRWLFNSREVTNFTYDLTHDNKDYLAAVVALVTKVDVELCRSYINELEADTELSKHVIAKTRASAWRFVADDHVRYAKRLGWYAFVRARKPRLVVETGVDKGLGSVVLCRALLKNAEEGHPGRYIGTDINPEAGYLLDGVYRSVGEIRYGDSITSLNHINENIDIFINDSDHSAEYESQEYRTVASKLSDAALILGDNSHVTPCLCRFARETGREFLFFREAPLNHWYPGAGIGISWYGTARGQRIE